MILLDVAAQHPQVLTQPAPYVHLMGYGDYSVDFRLAAFIDNPLNRLTVSSQLREAVNDKYNDAGIVIAFPQRDVHLNTLAPLEVQLMNPDNLTPKES